MNKIGLENKLNFQTKQVINDAVYQVLSDPDFEAILRPEVVVELKQRSRVGGKKVSLANLNKRYLPI